MKPWERFQAQDKKPSEEFKDAEKKPWERFQTTQSYPYLSAKQISQVFESGDPYNVFPADKRAEMDKFLQDMDCEDPEKLKQRVALSLFFSHKTKSNGDNLDDLESLAKVYTNGGTVEQCYKEVQGRYQRMAMPQWGTTEAHGLPESVNDPLFNQDTPSKKIIDLDKAGSAINSGMHLVQGMIKSVPAAVYDMDQHEPDPNQRFKNSIRQQLKGGSYRDYVHQVQTGERLKIRPEYGKQMRDHFFKEAVIHLDAAEYDQLRFSNGKGVVETFADGDLSEGFEQLTYQCLAQSPRLLIQTASSAVNPYLGAVLLGVGSTSQRMVELHDDGISDTARITNSMAYGLAEMIGEGYFTVPLIKNIFKGGAGSALKDVAASGVMGALKKTAAVSGKLGKGFVTEGSGEAVTEILQNAADLLTGAEELDYKSMSKPEILKHLVKGVPDSFLIGGTMGSGMTAASFGPGRKNSFSQADDLMAEVAHVLCVDTCLLYTSPSPRDLSTSRMPSSA
eukprot:TRINITY_DN3759_c0_g2_i7.p1 TRINITY_DN3759_c0_g2~~TRINITY_DN3759_c0_g2_i7.p1  ORF type:complete len:506 (+),score=140.52 TRINITY_DN3759_c0_g2_i7:191-1708(+)